MRYTVNAQFIFPISELAFNCIFSFGGDFCITSSDYPDRSAVLTSAEDNEGSLWLPFLFPLTEFRFVHRNGNVSLVRRLKNMLHLYQSLLRERRQSASRVGGIRLMSLVSTTTAFGGFRCSSLLPPQTAELSWWPGLEMDMHDLDGMEDVAKSARKTERTVSFVRSRT